MPRRTEEEEYNPERNEELSQRVRSPLRRRSGTITEAADTRAIRRQRELSQRYEQRQQDRLERTKRHRERREQIVQGTKRTLGAAEKEATGFIRDIRKEGIRSGFKVQRTLQRFNPLRNRRTRISRGQPQGRGRTVGYQGPGVGPRIISEFSQSSHPLDRQYFSNGQDDKDFFGNQQERELIRSSTIKKKEVKYY
jgi:hypothetical protein